MTKRAWVYMACLAGILMSGAAAAYHWAPKSISDERVIASELPYTNELVSFPNTNGTVLAGTLSIPKGAGPFPSIILIPGSGQVNRDGELFGHKFYSVLADSLVRRGFAVLRSDKRGLGKSGGDFGSATSFDFADDIASGVRFLRARRDVDSKRVGLVGHSEGGLIAPIVAGNDPAIAFVVSMAGNGVRGEDLTRERSRLFGVPALTDDGTPWIRTFLTTDPQPILEKIHCPVLAVFGEKDQAVPAEQNAYAVALALRGNSRAKVVRLAGLNHFFQTARTGAFSEVPSLSETMSPSALTLIGTWAAAQVGLKAPN